MSDLAQDKETIEENSLTDLKEPSKQEAQILNTAADAQMHAAHCEVYRRQKAVYAYEECIRHCLWFKSEVALVFAFNHGVTLTILLALVVVFVKVNITSLFYIFALSLLYGVQYYPSRFLSTMQKQRTVEQKAQVDRALNKLITLTSILILIEYTLITLHTFTYDSSDNKTSQESPTEEEPVTRIRVLSMVTTWENFVQEHFCPSNELNASKDPCVQDWNVWLEFGR